MSLPVLYGTIYCPFVQRARIVLAMVGKDYVFKAVDLMNKPKQYVRLNHIFYVLVSVKKSWAFFFYLVSFYPRSTCAQIAFHLRLTDISPYGKVPVMVDDGKVIYESAAINQYIDEKWGHGKLMGDDPFHRAMHRVSTHWSNTKFAPAVYHSLFNVNKTPDAENLKRVDEQLAFLESRMNPGMEKENKNTDI